MPARKNKRPTVKSPDRTQATRYHQAHRRQKDIRSIPRATHRPTPLPTSGRELRAAGSST
ncbi:MAG: hypothetical protein LBQ31_03620 [Bacteroidales bacterium]|nr:hypothetical protein [Bacteroidales bacterium]